MRILVVASRDPGGRQSGRKSVLTTIVAALRTLGHDVVVAAIARELEDRRPATYDGVPVLRLSPPGPAQIAANVAGRVARGRLSLNEALYDSPTLGRRLRAIAAERGCELAVADTIRTAALAARTGLPVVVDLDDLLSVRYAGWAETGAGTTAILGYYGEGLPAWARRAGAGLARRLLRIEVQLARRRELAIARSAAAVSLVSPAEAARLADRAGVEVAALPMAVPVPEPPADPAAAPAGSALFVGGLDYLPNLEGLRWLVREAAAPLEQRVPGFRLDVVGHCPDAAREELEHPLLALRGYVDDLAAELRGHRMLVAPILSGSGVKTKVVEAMAAGLPVVASDIDGYRDVARDGLEALLVPPGDVEALVTAVREVLDDRRLAASLGDGGARRAREFDWDSVTARLVDVYRGVLSRAGPPGQLNASAAGTP